LKQSARVSLWITNFLFNSLLLDQTRDTIENVDVFIF